MTNDFSTQVTQAPPSSAAPNLKALLQLHDFQFVESAYKLLLKRPPDPEGLNYYIKRIRAGVPKVKILGQLMESREAREHCVEIPGLRKAIRQQRMISLPIVGKVIQIFLGAEALDVVSPLNELLKRNNNEFVEYAYLTLLKRPPDHEGFNYYLGRLRAGVPKIKIIDQIMASHEARAGSAEPVGLKAAVDLYKFAQFPLIGFILKFFVDVEGDSAFERRLRAVEQQVFLIGQQAEAHFNHLEQNIAGLRQLLAQQVQLTAGGAQQAGTLSSNVPIFNTFPLSAGNFAPEPEGFNELPARTREIFTRLKTSISTRSGGNC